MEFDYKTIIYLQLILEAVIIVLLFVLILKKNKSVQGFQQIINSQENLQNILKEAEQAGNRLLNSLKEKQNLSDNITSELNHKLEEYQDILKLAKLNKFSAPEEFVKINEEANIENKALLIDSQLSLEDSNKKKTQEKEKSEETSSSKIKELILTLHKNNRPLDEIANETGLHLSEIELIINYEKTLK